MRKSLITIMTASLIFATTPALAHHSAVMYDGAHVVTLTGTVKQYDFVSPHSYIHLMVRQPDGNIVEWAIQLPVLNGDILKNKLTPGDKIQVRAHPLKDGTDGAILINVTLANGQVIRLKYPKTIN